MSDTKDSSSSSTPPEPTPVAAPERRIDPHEPRRTGIVSLAVIGALIVAAAVFRKPLVAWFTGSSTGGSTSAAAHVSAGGLSIDAALQPDPPRESGNHAQVVVRDAQGKPVTGAKVRLEYDMPAMGAMQAMHGGGDATEDGEGHYTVPFDLGMGGSWTITIRVTTPSASASARYTLRVGSTGLTPLGGESQGGAAATGSGSMGAMDMGSGATSTSAGAASPTAKGSDSSAGSGSPSDVSYYTCSMHPTVHSHAPGKCPICSMDLTPVTREEEQAGVIHIEDAVEPCSEFGPPR